MANTFFGLTIASSGLSASNIAINTAAHNISNVNTKGYTRQAASQEASSALRVYSTYGTVGTGVTVTGVEQLRSSYYDSKYWDNNSNYGQYKSLESYSDLIEDYLDEFNLSGFTTEYNNFFEAINTLTTNPTSEVARNQFVNYANSIAEYFNVLSTNISNVQKSANDEIKTTVDSINTIAQQIASINKQINVIEMNGGKANDLRDARNLLVDELSSYVNTNVTDTDLGNGASEYRVFINNQELVDGYNYNKLVCEARDTGDKRNASDIEGLYDIGWNTGMEFNVYSSSLAGSLKAAIDIRDGCSNGYEVVGLRDAEGNFLKDDEGNIVNIQDISESEYTDYVADGYSKYMTTQADAYRNSFYKGVPYYQSQLNYFAQEFSNSINSILAKGDLGTNEDGSKVAVEDFFVSQYGDSYITAGNIAVSTNITHDMSLLPVSFDNSKGEANTDMATELYALKDGKVIQNGTFSEYLASIVSVIAIDSKRASSFSTNYTNIQSTIDKQRMSVSGVDEDEEAVDLVKFQNAYGLASKVVSIMQDIYNKLIEETGV